MWGRYKVQPSFVLGFHGCDAGVAEDVFSGRKELQPSNNPHDWLGDGIYFWESSPQRALEWAQRAAREPAISAGVVKKPAVVGAVIDLSFCFSLFDRAALTELATAWDLLKIVGMPDGSQVPENCGPNPDRPLRRRDKAAIDFMHQLRSLEKQRRYDTVRGAFGEGEALFEGSGFMAQAHIQLAVRTPSCIKGYFRPIIEIEKPPQRRAGKGSAARKSA